MRKILQNPVYRFLFIGITLYLVWTILYEVLFVPNENIHFYMGKQLASLTDFFMSGFGMPTYTYIDTKQVIIGLEQQKDIAVWIGEPCNGIKLFGLFTIFILAYPAQKKIHKLWIIPLGILLIHFINVLRIIGLILVFKSYPDWIDFNHDYTFTIVVYAFIFVMWWVYIKYFGGQFNAQKNN